MSGVSQYFKELYGFDCRSSEASTIRKKYPNRVPVIMEKEPECSAGDLAKVKYLVPKKLTVEQLRFVIRHHLHMENNDALYLTVNDIVPSPEVSMEELYQEYRERDYFLYLTYSNKNKTKGKEYATGSAASFNQMTEEAETQKSKSE
ncbi:gamma-aminobutyric acid receptor-associated protein-like [Teleopsis dalmanni]|uniref:gamma-aminobutyric acid receptor-associated protein-like n=1 Tax=Teleopsis dalmanni TaxID=139649 RepID=UPI0018CEB893|nr:gamma-aminobutyric acid receptor-associated protein-like [Teleopsis dalmanni]